MDVSKYCDGKVHVRNSGLRGLSTAANPLHVTLFVLTTAHAMCRITFMLLQISLYRLVFFKVF